MRIILVHRWSGRPDSDWYPWLENALEQHGFSVVVPHMPGWDNPTIEAWVGHLAVEVGMQLDEQTFFVGHSIGCQTILRFLEHVPEGKKVGGVVLVAPWVKLRNLEGEAERKTAGPWMNTPIDATKVKTRAKKFVAIFSDNDLYVDLAENRPFFEHELGAKIIIEKGKGHFTVDDGVTQMPELLGLMQRLAD